VPAARWCHAEYAARVIRTGLCSVTLRALGVDDVVDVAATAGLRAIEWGADVHVPPGDAAAAAAARAATAAAGLEVASYGSYYRAGRDDPESFTAVVAGARELGAPRIRIWAGDVASAEATPADRARVALAARDAADRAAADGVEVAFEFHGGTLTDGAQSALRLLEAVERAGSGAARVRSYWQPPQDLPDDQALEGLRRLRGHVSAVHVFSWWPGSTRLRLAGRAELWRAAFDSLSAAEAPVDALLEFVPDDDPALVADEARTLTELLEPGDEGEGMDV
jgi:3-dehydroshikimate dehydratase